ncbi:CCA tRNA nucleotidyltransferase [Paenibacillus ehimensis]|uniref:CCA tRNA nucleotidyltransferase n=1 Tax=Paenibacillus ehimensis TaxID=79264 RepID=UPI0004728FB0|nr:CCA tRNA nucleotidyltransferase [Paenibacillus ehimensis]MEC0207705.1 CCA tRNA nucleotidyltransferase [Paenibacillus ehimensis]
MSDALKQGAMQIVRRLCEAGFEAYLVGGCVRDEQLGRPVKDYDIATSAHPEQVQRLFERTVPTGLQHGTVTVVVGKKPYEVTTFRREGGYEAFRRPTEVEYIDSLTEDLQRRDFTMNAMAIDQNGRLIDPFDGMSDLERGVLRCVGRAEERFGEDALRMMRCLRFASEYGLIVEQATWDALNSGISLLRHIAMERIRAELERMLGGSDPNRALDLLTGSKALRHVKQELLLSGLDKETAWPPLSRLTEMEHRLAFIYIRLGAVPAEVEEDMIKLTFSRHQMETVKRIVAAHTALLFGLDRATGWAEEAYLRRIWISAALTYGVPALRALREIYLLENRPIRTEDIKVGEAADVWKRLGSVWLEQMPVSALAELAVGGKDLMGHLGVKGGPWTGRLLHRLLESAALAELRNDKETLLAAAREHYENMQENDE